VTFDFLINNLMATVLNLLKPLLSEDPVVDINTVRVLFSRSGLMRYEVSVCMF
jgi:hypothetical protein